MMESRDELTDYRVYSQLAKVDRNGKAKEVFAKLSEMEKVIMNSGASSSMASQ